MLSSDQFDDVFEEYFGPHGAGLNEVHQEYTTHHWNDPWGKGGRDKRGGKSRPSWYVATPQSVKGI